MKRLMTVMLSLVFVISVIAMAGGDQNQGDKGKGSVEQHQERLCPECETPVGPNCLLCPECGCPQPPCDGNQDLSAGVAEVEPIAVDAKVSPHVIALRSLATWVTVHTDIPLGLVDRGSVALNGVPSALTKADLQGNLVAKFRSKDLKDIVAPPSAVLTLTGLTVDGTPFAGADEVQVKK